MANSTPLLSRRLLYMFSFIMALLVGQLSWWMLYHLRNVTEMHAAKLAEMHREQAWATRWLLATAQTPHAEEPSAFLAHYFPNLAWERTAAAPEDAASAAFYPGYHVALKTSEVQRLQRRHDALMRMFISEGMFFLLMVGLGALQILRTLRHESALLRQQGNFLSAVTHELKSPLAAIRLHTETLQLRDPPLETRTRYLHCMRADIERLENLVSNLLAVARLDADQVIVHKQRTELSAEVRRCVAEVGRSWQVLAVQSTPEVAPPPALQLEVVHAPLWVHCDAAALHTVLRNLLDNAYKYGAHQPVQLRVWAQNGRAMFSVRDGGIGFTPLEAKKLFQKFYRVGDEMVRQAKGSGLGLYLARALLQQSGGTLTASSPGPALGATFCASLPLHTASATANVPQQVAS